MRRLVQERTRQAGPAERDVQGQHTGGTHPRTLAYSQGRFWSMVIIGGGILLSAASALSDLHMLLPQAQKPGVVKDSLIFEAVCIALIVFLGVFVVKLPSIFLAAGMVALDTRRRRAERFTTRSDGIIFDDGRRQITAAWDEVTGYFIQPSPLSQSPILRGAALSSSPTKAWRWVFVIETERGSFQYSPLIDGSELLSQIIEERAMPLKRRDLAAK